MPVEKVVMGIPMYGRSSTLASAENTRGPLPLVLELLAPSPSFQASWLIMRYLEPPCAFSCPLSLGRSSSFNLTIIKYHILNAGKGSMEYYWSM